MSKSLTNVKKGQKMAELIKFLLIVTNPNQNTNSATGTSDCCTFK